MFDSGGSSGQFATSSASFRLETFSSVRWPWRATKQKRARSCSLDSPNLRGRRLGGHTSGNLLLSMMEQYSGDFLAAVDSLRDLLDCNGHVWPISVEHASVCAEYEDGSQAQGEVAVDLEQVQGRRIVRTWLDPEVRIHRPVADAIQTFDAVIIGPGSFFTSLMPILLGEGSA